MREPIRDKGRLEHILTAIDDITAFASGKSVEDIDNNRMLFFAIVKNIEIIGEAAFRLTKSFCKLHPDTPWDSIIKMRHVLVHDYYQIKSKEVWKVINDDLQPLRTQIEEYINHFNWQDWENNEQAIAESAVHKNLIQTAKKMLARGYEIQEIVEITGLSQQEISEL